MQLQLHAKRYADDPDERDQVLNSTPAVITLPENARLIIEVAAPHTVSIKLNDDQPLVLTLAEWDHTAVVLTY